MKVKKKKDTTETKDCCLYCQGAHPFSQCYHILAMSLRERVDVAVRLNACFHCSSTQHGAKNCPEKRNVTCVLCDRKGHIAIFHGRPALSFKGPSDASLRGDEYSITAPELENDAMNETVSDMEDAEPSS